ncbi:related to apoptosis-inducing TAF9-like domain 1 family protein, putative [Rhynchosporium secalis]|uniref:Related to apoptosis-inducing TAF9-like domain 1 family protein, putative n=1 Tax=Rhynchosporium secalis TaxID=38038 RepID=A0A1E1MTA2_RHYSE|nr:related to apoptosis-inducing TAF9-like domain 1 family protein, putative [Rhynchosporium secalis]
MTNTSLSQKLKASLWFSVGKLVDEEAASLNTTATPQFIGSMSEMVWAQLGTFFFLYYTSQLPMSIFLDLYFIMQSKANASPAESWQGNLSIIASHPKKNPIMSPADHPLPSETVAIDLESFSRHANRTTITTDDVLLMTRKNDALLGMMKDFVDAEKAKTSAASARKGVNKGKGRPKK